MKLLPAWEHGIIIEVLVACSMARTGPWKLLGLLAGDSRGREAASRHSADTGATWKKNSHGTAVLLLLAFSLAIFTGEWPMPATHCLVIAIGYVLEHCGNF